MAHPSDVLRWADSPTTGRTEPAEGTKDAGFAVNDRLPAQFFNWLLGVAGDWITWLHSAVTTGFDCNVQPEDDGTLDCGGTSNRWANVYGVEHHAEEYQFSTFDGRLVYHNGSIRSQNSAATAVGIEAGTGADVESVLTSKTLNRCAISKSSSQTLTDLNYVAVSFDGPGEGDYNKGDNGGYIWTAGDPTKFYATVQGYHRISAFATVTPYDGADTIFTMSLTRYRVCGTYDDDSTVAATSTTTTSASGVTIGVSGETYLYDGDYLVVRVMATNGGGDSTLNGARCSVSMFAVGDP